ncbi:hypothetical protein EAI_12980 [Harpegnathos saltator]|uniref:Uncharacterized protein n=1 Tax=Harpegnathos saltator TaxID=610380 RepID=E2B360_HARSA|nr:hypothetical protein EAI_12980 [Harpegnathos saltator]
MKGAERELDAAMEARFPDCGCKAEVDRLKAVVDHLAAAGPGEGTAVAVVAPAPTLLVGPGKKKSGNRETAPPKAKQIIPETTEAKGKGKKERKKENKKRKKARARLMKEEEEKRTREGGRGIAAKDLLEAGLDPTEGAVEGASA